MYLTQHLIAAAGDAASTGIFDWIDMKSEAARSTTINVSRVVAIVFIVYRAWATRLALASIVVAAVGAAIFLWIVSNVVSVQNRVGDEVNSLRAPDSVVVQTFDGDVPGTAV